MSQLRTLLWLKWMLFRNSLRTSKAVVNRIASALAMLAALLLSILMAVALGVGAYFLTSPAFGLKVLAAQSRSGAGEIPTAEFIFFAMFAMTYVVWGTIPVTVGSSRQFDPGHLLLYPISLRKLFAFDLVSEIASIPSVFAIPSILAIGIGAGLAQGHPIAGFFLALLAAAFGLVLSKWLSTSTNLLFRRKKSRGENLLALIGTFIGLGGLIFAQVAPILFRHMESLWLLRWTPPGAVAYVLTNGLRQGPGVTYALASAAILLYTAGFVALTYWLASRSVLGAGKKSRRERQVTPDSPVVYTGWELPFLSPQVSILVEKELRYIWRNAQVRMIAAMPLILIFIRLINRRRFGPGEIDATGGFLYELMIYGEGMIAAGAVLYVVLILSGISCNQFAFEHAGMRTLVLSPMKRSSILIAKNISTAIVTAVLSAALLLVNQIVFRDLTLRSLLFAGLSFVIYVSLMSIFGNWLSIRFPKRMKFGSRFNVSGAVGLLLMPMIILLALPSMAAVAAGFVTQSLTVEYATLAVLAVVSLGLYALIIEAQGEFLERRELELLVAVNDASDD